MGPKLVNCCMPEPMGTKEFGKMVTRIRTLGEGRVPAKEAKNWRIEGEQKRITRKECQRLLNNFDMEVVITQKRIVEPRKRKAKGPDGKRSVCGIRPNEEGDVVKEYEAMHEEHFWCSWLRGR